MSTAARQLPAHGTEYRYRGPMDGAWPGCRCAKCTHANHRGGKARRLRHLQGDPPLHPGGPVLQHVAVLHDVYGMSYALIARRAGVADATVTYLMRGLTKNLRRDKALRILAVEPADFDAEALRPAFRSIRRLRALYVIGHNPETISAETGIDQSAISHIANERHDTVKAATEVKIRKAYLKLSTTPGPSAKAKKRAAGLGWHGPLAWDDIDDPKCKPETEHCASRAQDGARTKVHADPARVIELTAAGKSAAQIAQELGCHKRTVTRVRGRYEQTAVAA